MTSTLHLWPPYSFCWLCRLQNKLCTIQRNINCWTAIVSAVSIDSVLYPIENTVSSGPKLLLLTNNAQSCLQLTIGLSACRSRPSGEVLVWGSSACFLLCPLFAALWFSEHPERAILLTILSTNSIRCLNMKHFWWTAFSWWVSVSQTKPTKIVPKKRCRSLPQNRYSISRDSQSDVKVLYGIRAVYLSKSTVKPVYLVLLVLSALSQLRIDCTQWCACGSCIPQSSPTFRNRPSWHEVRTKP